MTGHRRSQRLTHHSCKRRHSAGCVQGTNIDTGPAGDMSAIECGCFYRAVASAHAWTLRSFFTLATGRGKSCGHLFLLLTSWLAWLPQFTRVVPSVRGAGTQLFSWQADEGPPRLDVWSKQTCWHHHSCPPYPRASQQSPTSAGLPPVQSAIALHHSSSPGTVTVACGLPSCDQNTGDSIGFTLVRAAPPYAPMLLLLLLAALPIQQMTTCPSPPAARQTDKVPLEHNWG